jgi:hypothetical protein
VMGSLKIVRLGSFYSGIHFPTRFKFEKNVQEFVYCRKSTKMGLIMSSVLIGLLRALPGPITGLEIPAEDQSHSTAL